MLGIVSPSAARAKTTCLWCGSEISTTGRGRPRKYCSSACKQRSYEQRHNITGTPIPHEAVILSQDKADRLRDSLFELRCGAEDIATAAREEASAEDIAQLCDEVVALARSIEKLR